MEELIDNNTGGENQKKADFAASLHGLNYNIDVLLQKIDPSVKLELKPKSEYRKTAAFKDLPEDQFNTWYKGVETAFNAFEQNRNVSLDDPFIKTLFDTPYTRALQATDPRVKIGANIKQEFDLNPFGVSMGLASSDQLHQEFSVKEVAQKQNKVWDRKKKDWKYLDSPVGNFSNFLDLNSRGLIIATDEKGVPKLDNFGRTYYETMDGEVDPTGKENLIAKAGDFLTEEGSFANRYLDVFDSDQIESNTARSLAKNAIKIGSLFVPVLGKVVTGTTAVLNMAEMFAEGWKTFNALSNKLTTGDYKVDEDVESRANQISTIAKSWSLNSTTEEEQQNPWSIASLSNLLADGVSQIRTQRFIAQAPILGRALIDPKFRKALEAGDKSAQAFVNASKNLARAYMTGQAAMEVGEAFEQAGLDKATKDLAVGAAALAFGALYRTAPFDWMLDGVGVNTVQKAVKKVVEKEVKDLASAMAINSAKGASEVEKKALLAKGLSAIQNKVRNFMSKTNFAEAFRGAASESLEESTESIIGEGLKLGFQFLGKNNLIKSDKDALKKLDPFGENFLEDLALSAVAGGMSGGVFGAAQDIQLRKQARDISSLADISQSGYVDYALNQLENLRTIGKKGKGLLSDNLSTEIERIENGVPVYKPMSSGTALTSQNDYVINTVKQQLLSTHFALQGIGADKQGLEEKLKNANSLFSSVYADAKNSSLLEDAKQISKELIATRFEIERIENQYRDKISKTTGNDDTLRKELAVKIAPLKKKAEELQARYDEIAKVGKEKSQLAEDYLREALYKANPFAWSGFDIKSKSDFTEGKVGEELEKANREWEQYKLLKRNGDIKRAYEEAKDIYNNSFLFKEVRKPETNIDNLIKNQEVERLLVDLMVAQKKGDQELEDQITSQIAAIFEDESYTPTEEVLKMLKLKGEYEVPDLKLEYQQDGSITLVESPTKKVLKLEEFDSDNYKKQLEDALLDSNELRADTGRGYGVFGEKRIQEMEDSSDFEDYLSKINTKFEEDPVEYPLGMFEVMWEDPFNKEGYKDYLEPLMLEKLKRVYDIVDSIKKNKVIGLDRKLSQKNKKVAQNLAKKIKLSDIERIINDNYELFRKDPKNYRDVNPNSDSSITKQLKDQLKKVQKLKSTLQIPYVINPIINKAKSLNKDKFANPEPEFVFPDNKQAFYINNYLSRLQSQLEDLLDKLKQNQEGDIKIVRAGFLKGASRIINNILSANKIAADQVGFSENLSLYSTQEDDDILKSKTLDADAKKLYQILAELSDLLKKPEFQNRRKDTRPTRIDVDVPDLKNYTESYVFFEEALRRGDYREFLDRLHRVKLSINQGNEIRIPTFEQEFAIFQAYSMVQAARDGRLVYDEEEEQNKKLDFYNSIFIDGRPGIGKSDIIMRYLVELIKQDSGVEINISSKNDSVVDEVLAPKFGGQNVKKLSDLGFDATIPLNLEATKSHKNLYIHPFLPHVEKTGLHEQGQVRLKKVYLIDEATHLNTSLIKQMSEVDNAIFIFLGDTTQDGASETMFSGEEDSKGNKLYVTEPFFQYTFGMERVPRITLSLRNSTENYDNNAAKLEQLAKQLYQVSVDKLSTTFNEFKSKEENTLNFVYTETSKGVLSEGVKLSKDPLADFQELRNLSIQSGDKYKIAVISDNPSRTALYPSGTKVITSNTIQGQEFDYVVIDNISFTDNELETTRKLNTLLSRYRQAMVLPESITTSYPIKTTKKEGAVSKLVVLTPEVLQELKKFSLSITEDFDTTKSAPPTQQPLISQSSQQTSTQQPVNQQSTVQPTIAKPATGQHGTLQQLMYRLTFPIFEENDEDVHELKLPTNYSPNATYLYISFPNTETEFVFDKLKGLKGKQQIINDLREKTKTEFFKQYGNVRFDLTENKGEYAVTISKGNQAVVLFNLPSKQYLGFQPQIGEIEYDDLSDLIQTSNIFNDKRGRTTYEPFFEVKSQMEARGISVSLPVVVVSNPVNIEEEIEKLSKSYGIKDKKIKSAVLKDVLGLQGKAITFQSSDPDISAYIDLINQRYDTSTFSDYEEILFNKYIEHSLLYHAGLPEPFNLSIGFVKRSSKNTIMDYAKNKLENYKSSDLTQLPRMSRSEVRRLGVLIYNYMRSVVENPPNGNPFNDPLFTQLTQWKHGPGLFFEYQGGRIEIRDSRMSATELLFGFGYENGEFYEAVPKQKLENGNPVFVKKQIKGKTVEEPVIEYERNILKNKTDLPYKLKPYREKVMNPYAEVTDFKYEGLTGQFQEIKPYSVLDALVGIDRDTNVIKTPALIEALKLANESKYKSDTLKELTDFVFSYEMESAFPIYKIQNDPGTVHLMRMKVEASDIVNHNEQGRFPVLQVNLSKFNKVFGTTKTLPATTITKIAPPEDNTSIEPPDSPEESGLGSVMPNFSQSGDQEAPINSNDTGNLTPSANTVESWALSPSMYNGILLAAYEEKNGTLIPKKSAYDKVSLARLIYGANGEMLQVAGIDYMRRELLTPIYYYDYTTGEVLPDVYSEEGVKQFNEKIDAELKAKTAALQSLIGEDAGSEKFYLVLQQLILDSNSNPDVQKLLGEYLTLQNLHHLLNFELYPDISDVLAVKLERDEQGNIKRTFVPQNRIPDVTFNKESSERGGIESSSAFTKNMLQRLPRLILIKTKEEGKVNVELAEHPKRNSSYKEISKWLNEFIYNSNGELVDEFGNVNAKKLEEEFNNIMSGKSSRYGMDEEAIVNLHALLFNETENPVIVKGRNKKISIHSLSQAVKNAELEAIQTGDVTKLRVIQSVKTSTNLFSKLKWLSITAVDELNVVDQTSKQVMSEIAEKMPTFVNRQKRELGFETLLREVISDSEAVELILNSDDKVILQAKDKDVFVKMNSSQLGNLIQRIDVLLRNNKYKPLISSTTNVNNDLINTVGTVNVARNIENLVRESEANYENFKSRLCK